jgi:hypothetical protein
MTDWQTIARRRAKKYGIDPDIFQRQMGQEAHGEDLTSPAGAQGPAQIMPATARSWGVKNVHDIRQAYDAAAKHMAQYFKQYGSMRDALIAYNAGPGAVGHGLPAETQNYIKTILGGRNPTGGPSVASAASMGASPAQQAGVDPMQVLKNYIANTQDLFNNQPQQSGIMNTVEAIQRIKGVGEFSSKGAKPMATTTPTASLGGLTQQAPAGKGVVKFEGTPVAAWIAPALEYARSQGWKGSVNSGFRSFADQTRIWNSGVRPAAKPGTSNHEGSDFPRGAVDVSDAAQLSAILRKSKYRNLLVWAGAKDPVHFSHPHNGSY